MSLHFQSQAPQGAPVAGAVQPVELALDAHSSDRACEVAAAQAMDAFHWLFAGLTEECRENQRIIEAAQLRHDADGVLLAGGRSSEIAGEDSREGATR